MSSILNSMQSWGASNEFVTTIPYVSTRVSHSHESVLFCMTAELFLQFEDEHWAISFLMDFRIMYFSNRYIFSEDHICLYFVFATILFTWSDFCLLLSNDCRGDLCLCVFNTRMDSLFAHIFQHHTNPCLCVQVWMACNLSIGLVDLCFLMLGFI